MTYIYNKEDYRTENREIDFCNYYYFTDSFSDYEIEKIKKLGEKYPSEKGQAGGEIRDGYRKSKISWIPYNRESAWIYDRIRPKLIQANKIWNFDLHNFGEALQYGEYNSKDKGNYDWHLDVGDENPWRKISMSIQLSDPNDYEGGDLQFHKSKDVDTAPKEKGTIIFFPSFLCHRVTPVTKGVRHSLVTWITGPPYR